MGEANLSAGLGKKTGKVLNSYGLGSFVNGYIQVANEHFEDFCESYEIVSNFLMTFFFLFESKLDFYVFSSQHIESGTYWWRKCSW